MTELVSAKRIPFVLIGVQIAAVLSTALHPIVPLLLAGGLIGSIFLCFYQQPLLILLANEGFIKRTLIDFHPVFNTLDPSVLLAIAIALALLLRLRTADVRQHLRHNQNIIALYLIWVGWMIMASVYAPNAEWAVAKSMNFLIFNTLLFLGPFFLIRTRKESRIMLNFYLIYGLCITLLIIGQLLLQLSSISALKSAVRLSILSANPIGVGRVLSVCTAMSAMLIITGRGNWRWWGLPLAAFMIGAILTGSRGPILSLVAAVILLGLIVGGAARRRTLIVLVSLLAIVGLTLLIAPEGVIYRYKLLFATELTFTRQGLRQFSSILHRLQMWEMAVALWTQDLSHLFLGDGTAGYAKLFVWRDFRYPHNLPLEVLAEYGLLGAGIFCLHIGTAAKKTYEVFKTRFGREELMWLTAVITFLFSTLVSGDLVSNRFLWFFIGGLVSTISIKSPSNAGELPDLSCVSA